MTVTTGARGRPRGRWSFPTSNTLPRHPIGTSSQIGHLLYDEIQQSDSHVAAEVEARLLQALEDRWNKTVANTGDSPAWRSDAAP